MSLGKVGMCRVRPAGWGSLVGRDSWQVSRITEILTTVGVRLYCQEWVSDLTKEQEVEIGKEKTSQVIVRESSQKGFMKENGLGQVYLQERRITQKELSESETKPRAGCRQSLMTCWSKRRN